MSAAWRPAPFRGKDVARPPAPTRAASPGLHAWAFNFGRALIQPDGARWHYHRPVTGRIGEHPVRCCSPACHARRIWATSRTTSTAPTMASLAQRHQLTLPPLPNPAQSARKGILD